MPSRRSMPEVGTVGTRWGRWWGHHLACNHKHLHLLSPRPHSFGSLLLAAGGEGHRGEVCISHQEQMRWCDFGGDSGDKTKSPSISTFFASHGVPNSSPRWG